MRVRTSINLPGDLLRRLDHAAGGKKHRSRLIEEAMRQLLEVRARAKRDARDIDIIIRNARRLNQEAADVLDYAGRYGGRT